jgi:hypothetical protein
MRGSDSRGTGPVSDDTSSVLLVPMSDEAVISTSQTELIRRDDSDDESKLQSLVDTDNKPNDDDDKYVLKETVHVT